VERRVEEADCDGVPFHGDEDAVEVFSLEREQFGESGLPLFEGGGENHFAHGFNAVVAEEHVFGAA